MMAGFSNTAGGVKGRMRLSTMLLLLGAGLLSVLAGCGGGETDSKSMEQIHADEGVPVRVETVSLDPFTIEHTSSSSAGGSREGRLA